MSHPGSYCYVPLCSGIHNKKEQFRPSFLDIFFPFSSKTGNPVPKPNLIYQVERGEEPWVRDPRDMEERTVPSCASLSQRSGKTLHEMDYLNPEERAILPPPPPQPEECSVEENSGCWERFWKPSSPDIYF